MASCWWSLYKVIFREHGLLTLTLRAEPCKSLPLYVFSTKKVIESPFSLHTSSRWRCFTFQFARTAEEEFADAWLTGECSERSWNSWNVIKTTVAGDCISTDSGILRWWPTVKRAAAKGSRWASCCQYGGPKNDDSIISCHFKISTVVELAEFLCLSLIFLFSDFCTWAFVPVRSAFPRAPVVSMRKASQNGCDRGISRRWPLCQIISFCHTGCGAKRNDFWLHRVSGWLSSSLICLWILCCFGFFMSSRSEFRSWQTRISWRQRFSMPQSNLMNYAVSSQESGTFETKKLLLLVFVIPWRIKQVFIALHFDAGCVTMRIVEVLRMTTQVRHTGLVQHVLGSLGASEISVWPRPKKLGCLWCHMFVHHAISFVLLLCTVEHGWNMSDHKCHSNVGPNDKSSWGPRQMPMVKPWEEPSRCSALVTWNWMKWYLWRVLFGFPAWVTCDLSTVKIHCFQMNHAKPSTENALVESL